MARVASAVGTAGTKSASPKRPRTVILLLASGRIASAIRVSIYSGIFDLSNRKALVDLLSSGRLMRHGVSLAFAAPRLQLPRTKRLRRNFPQPREIVSHRLTRRTCRFPSRQTRD